MYGPFLCSMLANDSPKSVLTIPTISSISDASETIAQDKLPAVIDTEIVQSSTQPSAILSSQLMPDWSSVVYRGSQERISFKKFTQKFKSLRANFWYSVEETLHSAEYIQTQEGQVVGTWLGKIEERKSLGKSCNVLDIGSNGGYFSLLSRSVGCNVMAVDAQPWCLHRLSSSAAVNGFSDNFSITWGAVSDDPNLTLNVGATKCSGLWAVKNSEWINKESSKDVEVHSVRCVDIVSGWLGAESREIITLMKIDAEGSEVSIIRSALPLLKERRILTIMAEFVPDRTKHITDFSIVADTFAQLYKAGYACQLHRTVYALQELTDYFDMRIPMTGRARPDMWDCSLGLEEDSRNLDPKLQGGNPEINKRRAVRTPKKYYKSRTESELLLKRVQSSLRKRDF